MMQFVWRLIMVVVWPPFFLVLSVVQGKWENALFAPWHNLRGQFDDVDHYNEWHWAIRAVFTAVYWYAVYIVLAAIF